MRTGGESLTVFVIEDWEAFLDAVAGCKYRLYTEIRQGIRVILRARAGSIGFEREFDLSKDEDEELYDKIKEDLEAYGFVRVKKVVADDEFFY